MSAACFCKTLLSFNALSKGFFLQDSLPRSFLYLHPPSRCLSLPPPPLLPAFSSFLCLHSCGAHTRPRAFVNKLGDIACIVTVCCWWSQLALFLNASCYAFLDCVMYLCILIVLMLLLLCIVFMQCRCIELFISVLRAPVSVCVPVCVWYLCLISLIHFVDQPATRWTPLTITEKPASLCPSLCLSTYGQGRHLARTTSWNLKSVAGAAQSSRNCSSWG